MVTVEEVLDLIAEQLIQSEFVDASVVRSNQKTIRNGIISIGRSNSEKLLIYQKDVEANEEDLFTTNNSSQTLVSIIDSYNISHNEITISDVNVTVGTDGSIFISSLLGEEPAIDITNLLTSSNEDGTIVNPLNVGQFINIEKQSTSINVEQAEEYLDTNIYELLPTSGVRQDRINKLYSELQVLLPPELPQFDNDGDQRVDRNIDGDWIGSEQYYLDNSISAPQANPSEANIEEESAYITRLSDNASPQNSGKTIQDFRDLLTPYLRDIDEEPVLFQDEREEYENQSSGYLKFRNLNQGIIIRNTEDIFVEGLDPDRREYLETGFTIAMWVRFLNKTSEGTLFNFGSPERMDNKVGFKLETLVSSDDKRYLRLLVWNNNEYKYYDSHIGNLDFPKKSFQFGLPIPNKENQPNPDSVEIAISQYTEIPINYDEWYYIVATYNPDIDETGSDLTQRLPEYWMNNWNPFIYEDVVDYSQYIGETTAAGNFPVMHLYIDSNTNDLDNIHPNEYWHGFSELDIFYDYEGETVEEGNLSDEEREILVGDINDGYDDEYGLGDRGGDNFGQWFMIPLTTEEQYYENPFNLNNGELIQYIEDIEDDFKQFTDNTVFFNNVLKPVNGYDANIPDSLVGMYIEVCPYGAEFRGELMQVVKHSVSEAFGIARIKVERGLHQEVGFLPPMDHAEGEYVRFFSSVDIGEEIVQEGSYTPNSGFGNRSKVEIISRSDLLRARGYKV